jgi:hypothetical protein
VKIIRKQLLKEIIGAVASTMASIRTVLEAGVVLVKPKSSVLVDTNCCRELTRSLWAPSMMTAVSRIPV